MMDIQPIKVRPDQLMLDPNNYRFHDLQNFKIVAQRTRFSEPGVQEKALSYLQNTATFDLKTLKDSMRSNGFVPLDQIVVEKLADTPNGPTYLVVEGNRRTATVKSLIAEQKAGGDVSPEALASFQELPVIELIGTDEERAAYKKTLMAIRHVSGITEWGPYQQAKLVVELFDGGAVSFGAVAQRIGISNKEVARRYRASKALEQMEKDEEFGEHASPKLYVFFHEAVSQPKVRDWLKFSDETYKAENDSAKQIFYELMSPREIDGVSHPPKLDNASVQVRGLKNIVDKEYPLSVLSDPARSFDDALKAADTEAPLEENGLLEHQLGLALQALRRPGLDSWNEPSVRSLELWGEIVKLISQGKKLIGGDSSSEDDEQEPVEAQ